MKRSLILVFLIIFTAFYTLAQNSDKVSVVVIDPGHGGHDPGASGKHSTEKHIALSIALKAGGYIEKNFPDVKVIYTRKTDKFIPLHKRAQIANEANADLFLSIHCNAIHLPQVYGSETYVMGLHANDDNLEVARKENASILKEEDYMDHYDGFDPNSPEAYIIFSLYQNANLDQSLDIASKVQKQFKERVGLRDRGVLQAGFIVLYRTTMPSILIETGYLTNAKDEKFLLSKDGQVYIASAIYRAFKEYKLSYEKNASPNIKAVQTIKTNTNVFYRVQIASSNKDIRNQRKFKGLGEIFVYKHSGLNKYCVGKETSLKKAVELKNKMRKKKFKDAFVVAFQDGKRITIDRAKELLKK